MRFAHQTALRAAHRASRGVRARQTRISSAVMLTLRIWKHLNYRLVLHGQEGQAEQAQVKETYLNVTSLVCH